MPAYVALDDAVFEVGRVLAECDTEAAAKELLNFTNEGAPLAVVQAESYGPRGCPWFIVLRGRQVASTKGSDYPASLVAEAMNRLPQTEERP